jgi:hypothetical protein
MIAVMLASVLAFLSLAHVYWAAGGRGPSMAAVPHAEGRPAFTPTRAGAIVVAVGLAVAAVVALVCGGVVAPPVAAPYRAFGILLGLVFLARAIGEFRLVGFFKRVRGTDFAWWDTVLYSPLCVAMGVAFLAVAL